MRDGWAAYPCCLLAARLGGDTMGAGGTPDLQPRFPRAVQLGAWRVPRRAGAGNSPLRTPRARARGAQRPNGGLYNPQEAAAGRVAGAGGADFGGYLGFGVPVAVSRVVVGRIERGPAAGPLRAARPRLPLRCATGGDGVPWDTLAREGRRAAAAGGACLLHAAVGRWGNKPLGSKVISLRRAVGSLCSRLDALG